MIPDDLNKFVDRLMEMDRLKRQWTDLEKELLSAPLVWSRVAVGEPKDDKERIERELSKPLFFHAVHKGWVMCITEFDIDWQGFPPGSKGADGMVSGKDTGMNFRIPTETAFKLVALAKNYLAARVDPCP